MKGVDIESVRCPKFSSLLFGSYLSCSRVCESASRFVGFETDRKSKIPNQSHHLRSALREWRERRRNLRKHPSEQHQDMLDIMEQLTTAFVLGKVRTKTSTKTRNALESGVIFFITHLNHHSLTYNTHSFTGSC